MCVFELSKLCEILRFWNFSRNRLAGHDWPLGNSSFLCEFWVMEDEPPSSTLPTARRRVISASVLQLCLNCLAVMNFRQATRTIMVRFS